MSETKGSPPAPDVERLCALMERAAAALLHAETDAEIKAAHRLVFKARDLARKIAYEAKPPTRKSRPLRSFLEAPEEGKGL